MVKPASHCPSCGAALGFFDLIPIISYILLKGRCRNCDGRISPQYPLVEIITGILFGLAVTKYGPALPALRIMVILSLVIPAAMIDLRYRIIPDELNLAALLPAILLLFESKTVCCAGLIGFITGGGLLLLAAVLSRGGMGGGDIKLAAVLGLLLGWQQLLVALFLAFASGSVIGIIMLLSRLRQWREPIPFGPYLALGAIGAAFCGDNILAWYVAGGLNMF